MPLPRRLVLGAILVALLVAGAAGGAVVWLVRYAPLSSDGGGFVSYAYERQHVRAYVAADPGPAGRDIVYPRFRPGRDYFVGFTVWNAGRFDVTCSDSSDSRICSRWSRAISAAVDARRSTRPGALS